MGVRAFIILVLLCISPAVFAQKTAVLVTVRVADDPEAIDYWWRDNQPLLTPEIAALHDALSMHGIKIVVPADLSRVSRIVREPTLSDLNAMNLSKVIGADQALVGDLVRSDAGQFGPLQLSETQFNLNVRILRWPNGVIEAKPLPMQSVSVFSSSENRRTAGTFLGDVVSTWLVQPNFSSDEVGLPVGPEPRLIIPRSLGMAPVDAIRSRLAAGPAAKVVVAWVSDSVVAFEMNPNKTDTPETIHGWVNTALATPFVGFSARLAAPADADGSLRLEVQALASP